MGIETESDKIKIRTIIEMGQEFQEDVGRTRLLCVRCLKI